MTLPVLHIAVPAWRPYYVDLACRYTIPAIRMALAASPFTRARFLVHTDDEASFREAVGEWPVDFYALRPLPRAAERMERLPGEYWAAFKQAHRDALSATPAGDVCVLLNSDVVVSRECFAYVAEQLEAGKNVIASVGIRTEIESDGGPPLGVSAGELFGWIWRHRHPITEECIWGTGKSLHPTILYFDDGVGNVAMHCFHLTPMFIRQDRRSLRFHGTIDDDLLAHFDADEIAYPLAGEVAFAELSPTWKTHPAGRPLSVAEVVDFWSKRAMRGHYLRNFRQRLTVLGDPQHDHAAVSRIVAAIEGAPMPRVEARQSPLRGHVRGGNQHPDEMAAFLAFVRERGIRRYLEIGSRNGDSFHAVMAAIGRGGYGVAVDLPENMDAQGKLLATMAELRGLGCEVNTILGDCADPLIILKATAAGPFDLVLIDADHRYEGISRDFVLYRDLAPLVALHDVAAPDGHMSDGHPNGVGKLWREISGDFDHREIVAPGSLMGFGILFMRQQARAA